MVDSPNRLTALTLFCGLLSTASCVTAGLPSARGSQPLLTISLVCAFIGLTGMYKFAYTLREGVRNQRWPAQTLAPFRKTIDHPAWKLTMGVLFLATCLALVRYAPHVNGFFWGVFLLLKTQMQISGSFARPKQTQAPVARLDWSKVQPLTSDHWGNP